MNGSSTNEQLTVSSNQEMTERLEYSFIFESLNETNSDQIKTFLLSEICQENSTVFKSNAENETKTDVEYVIEPGCNFFIENYLSIELSKEDSQTRGKESDNGTTTTTTTITYQLSISILLDEFINLTKENFDELDKSCPNNNNNIKNNNNNINNNNNNNNINNNSNSKDNMYIISIGGEMELVLQCVNMMIAVLKFSPEIGIGCHELLSEWNPILDGCKFWLEGVSLCAIGLFGLCGNTLAIVVLGSTKDSNR